MFLLPGVTKVLHRKRPGLIPMPDNVVLGHYLRSLDQAGLWPKTQDKRHAAGVGCMVLQAFRADLIAARAPLEAMRQPLADQGLP